MKTRNILKLLLVVAFAANVAACDKTSWIHFGAGKIIGGGDSCSQSCD